MTGRLLGAVLLFALGAAQLVAAEAGAGSTGPQPGEAERVAGLCRAWTAVRFLHPWLTSREIDWDAAFANAVPRARAAESAETYRSAVESMLAALGDPATYVAPALPAEPEPTGEPVELVREIGGGVLLVDLAGFERARGARAVYFEAIAGGAIAARLGAAEKIVVDLRLRGLRAPRDSNAVGLVDLLLADLAPAPAASLPTRKLTHWGYAPQEGDGSGGYASAFVTALAEPITPAADVPTARRTVVLVDFRHGLPSGLAALQAAGAIRIVAERELDEALFATSDPVALPYDSTAWVRIGELAVRVADSHSAAVVAGGDGAHAGADPALARALELLAEPFPLSTPEFRTVPPGRRRIERDYPEMVAPEVGYRALAACRLWGVVEWFYPYRELLPRWPGALEASLPEFLAAESAEAYLRAVYALAARVEDGHTAVYGHPGVSALFGEATLPLSVRRIEERWAVTAVAPEASAAGVAVGDVVETLDERRFEERVAEVGWLAPGSTPAAQRHRAARIALRGAKGSVARLELEGADGERRRVQLERSVPFWNPPPAEGPKWRILDNGVGYVDLVRLETSEVDAMFAALWETPAIVFDLRGYPRGTGWPISSRLNARGAEVGALFRRREVAGGDFEADTHDHLFAQKLPPAEPPFYRGRTTMLIDDRAISQAEHTALLLEAAAGTRFVGSPTAGANGDVTLTLLPGGIRFVFTGHDVRHADGRQLQRLGIQPHMRAEPTLVGLRAGRDELLEAALRDLEAEAPARPAP